MRIATFAAALILCLACSPLGAAGPNSSPDAYQAEPAAVRGGTLTASDFEYPVTLNPLTGLTDLELRLGGLVFAPLWGFDDQLRPYADLAREVPTQGNGDVHTSPDSRSMTVDVKLSPGLRWSDGQPLTADDVIFTLQALKDPATQALSPAGLDRLKDVRRVSGSELLLTFDGIYAPYLQLGAGLFVMPKHRLGTVSRSEWSRDAFFQRPDVASGPFVVQDAVPGDRIVFGANPGYATAGQPHRHRVNLDRLVFKAQTGKAALLAALGSGAAELGLHLAAADLPSLTGMASSSPLVSYGLRDVSVLPNHRANSPGGRPPPWLDDPRVLDALNLAVDRSEIVRQALAGAGRPARGVFPRALRGYADGTWIPAGRDLPHSQRLFEEAGWSQDVTGLRSKDGRRLDFGLLTVCGSALDDRVMQTLRAQWQEAGAGVSASCLPRDAFLRATAAGAFDMALASNGWGTDPNDWAAPAAGQSGLGAGLCPQSGLQVSFSRGASTLQLDGRRKAYQQAEREWLASHCTLPLVEVPQVTQVSTRLRNFAPSPGPGLETWNAADWWLAA
ncbi:MAG TPA: ABC transporter substrate-binding protein [Candidatus Dormibacteraeota bacterium]